MTNGLIRVLSNQDIKEIKDKNAPPEPEVRESAIAGHIRKIWERNKLYRQRTEARMMYSLRARKGLYSSAELAKLQSAGGLNIIWADLTETKCRAASAWLREILTPANERAWSVSPTPMPELPVEIKQAVVAMAAKKARAAMTQMAQAGGEAMSREEFVQMASEIGSEMRDDILKQYRERADKAAAGMETKIADLMDQGGWLEAMDGFIEDFVTYPAAILKGPFFRIRKTLKWLPGFKPAVTEERTQCWQHVSPFDIYPSPHSKTCQDGELIERMRLSRDELHSFIGLEGYHEEEIRKALRDYSRGLTEQWLWTEAERQRLEQDSLYEWLTPAGTIDALHYWGKVPGFMLLSWGMDAEKVDDPVAEYEVDAILVGHYVVRCEINRHPLQRRPYYKASYDETPNAFWGRSIPDLIQPHQKMCNAIACALADNLSIASGPQVWVHNDRLADGPQDLDMYPWKRWQLKSDPSQGVNPGIGFFQPSSNANELMTTYNQWEQKSDDASGIPRYVYGDQNVSGATQTLGGLSLLMGNAAKGLRRAVASVDVHVIEKTVEDCFVYEMLHGDDQSIKGDCAIVARGAAALLVKDAAQRNRMQALQITGNPIDMQIIGEIGRAKLLRETLSSLEIDVDGVVPSKEDLLARQQTPPQPDPTEALKQQGKQQELAADMHMHNTEVAKDLAVAQLAHQGRQSELATATPAGPAGPAA